MKRKTQIRLAQWFYGSFIFSLPHIYKLKNKTYEKLFNLEPLGYLGSGVRFCENHYMPGKTLIRTGKNVRVSDNVYIDYSGGVTIGDNVTISQGAKIFSHKHPMRLINSNNHMVVASPVIISDGVWIGVNSIIMPGVKIGKNTVIMPGAVVTKDVGDRCMVQGNPGVVIASLGEKS